MNDTDLIRLASRIKSRSRDLEVIELCDAVLSTGHRAASTGQVVIAPTGCPTCQRRRDVERDKKRRWRRQASLGMQQPVKA